jgi:hypothetical protein
LKRTQTGHRLTFYDTLADVALTFNQGDNVFAEGSIQQRQYTPADGSKRTVNEVVVHYTPTHGSWLNQAEIEISIFSRQCLGTRRIPNLKTLRREVRAWNPRIAPSIGQARR